MDHEELDPVTFEKDIIEAWDAHILKHGGEPRVIHARDRRDASEWLALSDADRLERYWSEVRTSDFKRHVTYQLYYLTELAIWLYKRMPMKLLSLTPEELKARANANINANGKKRPGRSTHARPRRDVKELRELINGRIGNELAVPRLEALSHEPPPPPPGSPQEP